MIRKLFSSYKNGVLTKEHAILIIAVLLTAIVSLWVFSNPKPDSKPSADASELSLTIPKGYSIAPLELTNAIALNSLVTQKGIIDVFESGQKTPLIQNLRIIKLQAGEGPLFGALLPDKLMSSIQPKLSKGNLRGVLKPADSGVTQLHFKMTRTNRVDEIFTKEDL